MKERTLHSLDQTRQFALDFWKSLSKCPDQATIIGLSGDLGSGKTTFIKLLADSLGIKEEVTSPTFVIMKKYQIKESWKNLIHIDAYRLEDASELKALNFLELVADCDNVIFIEWPENVSDILRNLKTYRQINFTNGSDEQTRIVRQ